MPFDPLRLLLGIRRGFCALLLLSLAGIGAGVYFGQKLFRKDSFSVSYTLRKTEEAGAKPERSGLYRPNKLEDEMLTGLAFDEQVLRDASAYANVKGAELKNRGKVRFDQASQAIELTFSWPTREGAVRIAESWANAMIQKSKMIMVADASDSRSRFDQELQSVQRDKAAADEKLLQAKGERKIIDPTINMTQLLQQQDNLEAEKLKIEAEIAAKGAQTLELLQEIKKNHPLRDVVSRERMKLTELESDWQPGSDVIKKQTNKLKDYEAKLKAAEDTLGRAEQELGPTPDPKKLSDLLADFRQSALGQNLYLKVTDLVAAKEKLTREAEANAKRALLVQEKLVTMPKDSVAINSLKNEQEQLLQRVNELKSKRDAAGLYANRETCPGYFKPMSLPTEEGASLSTGKAKATATTVGFGLLGIALGLLLAFLKEVRQPTMGTMLQTAITTQALPRCWVMQEDQAEDEASLREFWLTSLARPEGEGRRILFGVVGEAKGEFLFWKELLECIKRDNALALCIDVAPDADARAFSSASLLSLDKSEGESTANTLLDSTTRVGDGQVKSASGALTPPTARNLSLLSQSTAALALGSKSSQPLVPKESDQTSGFTRYLSAAEFTTEELSRLLRQVPPHCYVLCRWAIGPTSALASVARDFDQHYLLSTPLTTPRKVAESQSRIFRRILDEPDGLVLLNEPANNRLMRLVNRLETRYFQRLASEKKTQRMTNFSASSNSLS